MKRFALLGFAVLVTCAHVSVAYGLPSSGTVVTRVSYFGQPIIDYQPGALTTRIAVAAGNSIDGRIATFRELNGGPISAPDGCSGSGTSVVTCVSAVPWWLLHISGGIGNDNVDIRAWHPVSLNAYDTEVFPGPGNDLMQGSPGNDDFEGDLGADVAYGNGGDDSLDGQDGADRLFGGDGTDGLSSGKGPLDALWLDRLDCGAGYDYAHFSPPDVAVRCESRS